MLTDGKLVGPTARESIAKARAQVAIGDQAAAWYWPANPGGLKGRHGSWRRSVAIPQSLSDIAVHLVFSTKDRTRHLIRTLTELGGVGDLWPKDLEMEREQPGWVEPGYNPWRRREPMPQLGI